MNIVFFSPREWSLPEAAIDPLQHQLTRLEGALAELPMRALAVRPDLLLLAGLEPGDALLEVIETLSAALPASAIVLICTTPEPGFLMRAMRAGVREVLSSDAPAVIASVIARAQSRLHVTRASQAPPGRCIGFMPAKGGDGCTCVMANLGAEIAKTPGLRVLLIDLSLPFGDVELFLTSESAAHDLADFSDEIERLDGALLEVMTHHLAPNLHLIHAPQSLAQLLHVTPTYVERLIHIALHHYDYVLIDMGLDAISLSVLELLDQLVVVSTASLPSVRRASQIMRLWESLGYTADKLSLVVNRMGSSPQVQLGDLEKAVGLKVSRVLPEESDQMEESLLKGVAAILLKPRSGFAKAIATWAAQLTGQPTTGKSLWHRFGIK